MAPDDSGKLLFPIGQCIGAYHDFPASTDHFTQVRVGADIHQLDDEQFAIWGLAHGAADRPVDEPWTRRSVLTAARAMGVRQGNKVLAGLISDHLLAETTPGTNASVDFARQHRLVPSMLGLGNTAEEPWIFSVGLLGMPIVQLSAAAYDLYEWAHLDPNLWVACQGAAATARKVGIEESLVTDPGEMLQALLSTLHVMLSPNAAYLDSRV